MPDLQGKNREENGEKQYDCYLQFGIWGARGKEKVRVGE